MRRHRWEGFVLAVLLASLVPAGAYADDSDASPPTDEAGSACVTKCEEARDACQAAAKARAEKCAQQQRTCENGCALCRRMNGPRVVYCVQDCERCRAQLAASPCPKDSGDDACARTLESCLERCGP